MGVLSKLHHVGLPEPIMRLIPADMDATVAALCATAVAATAACFYYLLNRRYPRVERKVPLDNQSIELQPGLRTSAFAPDGKLISFFYDDAKTLHECLARGLSVSNNGPCLGMRPGPNMEYEWITYQHVWDKAQQFGSGLLSKGLTSGDNSFVGIYAANSFEWIYTEQALNMFSMVSVPLYDTLGPDACSYIINQTMMQTVVVDKVTKAHALLDGADQTPSLKLIVVFESPINNNLTESAAKSKVEVITIADLMELGKANLKDPVPPKPSNVATICYTSGTTGNPKGVVLTHENLVSNTAAVLLAAELPVNTGDVHISYLPLAHMFERIAQLILLMHGARIGFFGGDVRKLLDDIGVLKPTIFVTVPRLLNRIYDKVVQGASASVVKSFIFNLALNQKQALLRNGIVTNNSIWDTLVFNKIQKLLGGRVKFVITGSAPLSGKVMDFIRCAFGCTVIEGYGQTECTAGVTFQMPYETEAGHVGAPLPCNLVKLVDVPEMDYFVKDNKGEVWVKGKNVMKEYFKDPVKTAETMDKDGWVATGDVGMWLPNGTLRIIDRRKHIFKLAQGEYIAPEKIEGVYLRSPLVAQAFVDGSSLETFTVTAVVPDPEVLPGWAKKNGYQGDYKELCQNPAVKRAILENITKVGKEAGLKSFEQVKAIHLHDELFSLENGLLTPTFKSKRPALRTFFKQHFDALYAEASSSRL